MLTIHQAILIPQLHNNLISTMQMHDNDLCVNEELKQLAMKVTEDHHTIIIPEVGDQEMLRIPLSIHGVISYFPMRKPTPDRYEACDVKLDLMTEAPDWDPSTTRFRELEEAMTDNNGTSKKNTYNHSLKTMITMTTEIWQVHYLDAFIAR